MATPTWLCMHLPTQLCCRGNAPSICHNRFTVPTTAMQEHSSRFNPAVGLEPGKLVKDLRLVGAQVGCVLGKSGENIGQIRKVLPPSLPCLQSVTDWRPHSVPPQ